MAAKGGQPGNKNAVKETRMVTNALRRAAAQNPEKLKKACEKVLNEAVAGNLNAFNVLADRLDGKPAQSLTLSGDEENPLTIQEVKRTVVNPEDTDS